MFCMSHVIYIFNWKLNWAIYIFMYIKSNPKQWAHMLSHVSNPQIVNCAGNTFSSLASLVFDWTIVKDADMDGFPDSYTSLRWVPPRCHAFNPGERSLPVGVNVKVDGQQRHYNNNWFKDGSSMQSQSNLWFIRLFEYICIWFALCQNSIW